MQFPAADLERLTVQEKIFTVAREIEHGRAMAIWRAMADFSARIRFLMQRRNTREPGHRSSICDSNMFHNVHDGSKRIHPTNNIAGTCMAGIARRELQEV
ncbi:hypothetical protein [Paraburkholderia sp.]|uniref:hypothetical protein n=1 Tax=Paraburkholderia sp. TaxID=1926495 RepID=UPI0025E8280D|nr:hypothetical protein [Paraburkholderia sp.]